MKGPYEFDEFDDDLDPENGDVCEHGLGFDEYCEDCDDEDDYFEDEDSDED